MITEVAFARRRTGLGLAIRVSRPRAGLIERLWPGLFRDGLARRTGAAGGKSVSTRRGAWTIRSGRSSSRRVCAGRISWPAGVSLGRRPPPSPFPQGLPEPPAAHRDEPGEGRSGRVPIQAAVILETVASLEALGRHPGSGYGRPISAVPKGRFPAACPRTRAPSAPVIRPVTDSTRSPPVPPGLSRARAFPRLSR